MEPPLFPLPSLNVESDATPEGGEIPPKEKKRKRRKRK
jgi:hypothetical protein